MIKIRNKITSLATMLLSAWLTAGCSLIDDEPQVAVETALAYSVASTTSGTRMSPAVVQAEGGMRGLCDAHIIPFNVKGRKITASDLSKLERVNSMEDEYTHTNANFYYNEHCAFMTGVASFLVYARALPTYGYIINPTVAQKAANGALDANFPADMNPATITFTPAAIYPTSTPDAKATALAAYLTAIANTQVTVLGTTYKWGALTAPAMKAMYQNFIGQENVTAMDIAGSSTNVLRYVNELYTNINGMLSAYVESSLEYKMCQAILTSISTYEGITFADGAVTSLGETMSGFPSTIGLPDGAAVVRWTGAAFEPQTQTTTLDQINGIVRYAYPAELYYHANSLIKTSTKSDQKPYYTSADTWNEVLSRYEYDNGVVSANTTAVAIKEPLQYALAHLQVKLKQVSSTLKDAADNDITIGTNKFPLTAIIVGNQHQVGFDFKPRDTEDYFMYDNNVTAGVYLNNAAETAVTHTLALQSSDDEEITVVLEFQNNSSQTIEGIENGLIYPGTKFYLISKVKPETVSPGAADYMKRVFTQDHTTTMTMKVESLAKAYNIVPNLLSPRLEIGVQVITDWMQATPTNVMLE